MTASITDAERRLYQLETLYEIGRECARVRTVPEALQVILSMLMGAYGSVAGVACLGRGGALETLVARGLPADDPALRESLAAWLARDGSGVPDRLEPPLWLPIPLDEGRRGAIALGARLDGTAFTPDEIELAETIVASAAPYLERLALLDALARSADELERRVRALTAANEVVLALAAYPSQAGLHRLLLDRIAAALGAEEAALVHEAEAEPSLIARHPPSDAGSDELLARVRACDPAPGGAGPADSRPAGHALIVPVQHGSRRHGSLWLRRAAGRPPFDPHDVELLRFLGNQAGAVLEHGRLFEDLLVQQQEQFRLRGMLEQYLAPSVAERLITGETRPLLEGTRLGVTVLLVDMRRSTELINHLPPELMVRLLNTYLGRVTDVLFKYEGTVDKFLGDAVLGFFGAPEAHPDDPVRAVRAAAEMQRTFMALRTEWARTRPVPDWLGIGVGVATGEVVVGNIGSAKHLEHTIIGATVNLATRLCAAAPAGTIHVDEATWLAASTCEPGLFARGRRPRRLRAKGFAELVPFYRLLPDDVRLTQGD